MPGHQYFITTACIRDLLCQILMLNKLYQEARQTLGGIEGFCVIHKTKETIRLNNAAPP